MSLADLRKELKTMRKSSMPVPVSRMKKTECVREIERLRMLAGKEEKVVEVSHKAEEKAVKKVMKEEKVPAKVEKKVEKVQVKAHKEEEKSVKAPAKVKVEKGSQAAKDKMAALRALRKKKDE